MNIFGKTPPQLPEKVIAEIDNLKDFDLRRLNAAAGILNALAHKVRLQIVELVREQKIMTVTDVFTSLRLQQGIVSRHLSILRKEGLLTAKREGKLMYYYLNPEQIKKIDRCLVTLLEGEK